MALSTSLICRLKRDDSEEPLAKRLKLAENVFYSPDLPIVCKEDCIFRWLCDELSVENNTAIWITIHRCLSVEPKSFSRLSLQSKNFLIEKLIKLLTEYPESEILEEMLKSCNFIFLNTNIHSYSKENRIINLMSALLTFTSKVLSAKDLENNKSNKSDIALESTETAIIMFAQVCRQSFSEKRNFLVLFIEQLLFPLASLVNIIKAHKIVSKVIIETEKCIKRLLLNSIRTITTSSENTEDNEIIFSTMKTVACLSKVEDVVAAFTYIFQCTVNSFQQNFTLIDTILRKLLECTNKKTQSKKLLTTLLENSGDISYNFDNEIDGVTLKDFLKNQIEEVLSRKKCLKCEHYNLLRSIAKLNPLITEDLMQNILERVIFEVKSSEEETAYENLLTELWKASVRLRRHPKFLSKFLLTIANYQEKKVEDLSIKDNFKLPVNFIVEFKEDIRSKSTSSQIFSIFQTLMFHLKSDCIDKLTDDTKIQICMLTKIVSEFFVIFFEHSNFLDNTLPQDWQIKFYQTFTNLRDSLILFVEKLCEVNNCESVIILSYLNIVKIWCESYDLLRYYAPNIGSEELDFPVNDSQFKELKRNIKKIGNKQCEQLLNEAIFYQSVIYSRDNPQPLKEKMITELWFVIIENHFEIVESFNEAQILQLTACLVNDVASSESNLLKWSSIIKKNIQRITKKFTTATVFQIVSCMTKEAERCLTKRIIETINFEEVLQLLDNEKNSKKVLKIAKKEIVKQNFDLLNSINIDSVKRNLQFLSCLPVSFLDPDIKILLFLILYAFEEEVKHTSNFKKFTVPLYLDLLRQNNINILNDVPNPALVNHFKDNQQVLLKIVKLSLSSLTSITFWENFINSEDCNKMIISILLKCVDNSKSKTSSAEHKTALHNLSSNLISIFIKELNEEIEDINQIVGFRVSLKAIFVEKEKLKKNVKKCVKATLKKIVDDDGFRSDSNSINECLQLFLIVLSHRENFNIDEEITRKFCIIFINNPDVKLFFHFLEVLKDNEFEFFVKSLNDITKESVNKGDIQTLENVNLIWQTLSKAEAKGSRSKTLSSSVNNLFNDLLCAEINGNSSTFLLNIIRAIVTSKRMIQLSNRLVDSTFVLSLECLNGQLDQQTKLTTCQEALGLCSDFVRSRAEFTLDKLPLLTNLFRKIIDIIFKDGKETNFSDERTFTILAIDIEKFCSFFAKLKKDVARISPYLIADMIKISANVGVLPPFMKVPFNTSLSHLLSNCDRHGISFLSRTLPTSTQQIFKTIYENYTKYHKFTGKI